jgi:tetratricopeptide (TPR) repeat protein
VELQPNHVSGWGLLALLLHINLKRYTEAEEAYRKTIELKPDDAWARGQLVALLIEQEDRRNEGLELAEKYSKSYPEDVFLLNGLAWTFYSARSKVDLGRAEAWAREAVRLSPDESGCQHTYACILCAMNKGDEALAPAEKYFNDATLVSKRVDDAIELGVQLAVAGVARQAVDMLQESPSAAYLEPLIVGLKVFLGEEVKAAAEILEVGKDVAKRISERKGGRS